MIARGLVVALEDIADVSVTICSTLTRDGWSTETAYAVAEGRRRLQQDDPRIAVVGTGLPAGNDIASVW